MPDIDSALPVLIARDFSPLVTIDALETAAPDAEIEVGVTCYNPSPRPLRATPGLLLPSGWKARTAPAAIVIPAWGARRVAVRVRSGGSEERSVVTARVNYATGVRGGAAYVHSVPVDIFAKAPSPEQN